MYKKLHKAKVFVLETLVPTPFIKKIKITISKPNLLNINFKLIIMA